MKDYRIYLSFGDDIRATFYIKAESKKKAQKTMERILPTYPDEVVRIVETSTLTIKEKKGK
jgi:hypothetical protein